MDEQHPKRETLTDEVQHGLSKLECIVDTLRRGENVQNRQLQHRLSEDEHSQIEDEWEAQKSFREEPKDKPTAVRRRNLFAKIDEQIQLAANNDYTPTTH